MDAPRWEHYEHQADIGVRGIGATLEAAFEQAAIALTAVVTDPAMVKEREAVALSCTAPDRDLLLADWLNALVYAMATRRMVFGRFAVHIDGDRLAATAWGEPVDVTRHRPAVEVKGATYTDLTVRHGPGGEWIAQCVVDV
jgi:SHS2 domain-containing protein